MRDAEDIERLIKSTAFKASTDVDEHLRAHVAGADSTGLPTTAVSDRRQIGRFIMSISTKRIAIAAVICVAIGAGAVVGVSVRQYFYLGHDEGGHRFISDDRQSVVTMDEEDVPDVEQARNDLQEMRGLSEQGKREVIRAIEITVDGRLERRLYVYRYELADGRTREMGEAAPGSAGQWTLTDAQNEEMTRLKKASPGEDAGAYEEEVLGRTFAFRRQRYVLHDGTEIVWSIGEPKAD